MKVVSKCMFRVLALPWQPRAGTHALTVICKATFDLRSGESPLSASQMAVWSSMDGMSMSDLVPFKRHADVIVLGRAYPQSSTPHAAVVRLHVGDMQKVAEARADQGWSIVGLGPIAPADPRRMAFLGRHAQTWDHSTWNARPMPDDLDGAYFSVAPRDQQMAELSGTESIRLDCLHPTQTYFETKLAQALPRAVAQRANGEMQEVRLRCDTLCIDTLRCVAFLVWRGVVILTHTNEGGLVEVTAGAALPPVEIESADLSQTLNPANVSIEVGPVLPFARKSDEASMRPMTPPPALQLAPPNRHDDGESTQAGQAFVMQQGFAALPFVPSVHHVQSFHRLGLASETVASVDEEYQTLSERQSDHGKIPPNTNAPSALAANESAAQVPQEPPLIGPIATSPAQPLEPNATNEVDIDAAANDELPVLNESKPCADLTLEQYATIAAHEIPPEVVDRVN